MWISYKDSEVNFSPHSAHSIPPPPPRPVCGTGSGKMLTRLPLYGANLGCPFIRGTGERSRGCGGRSIPGGPIIAPGGGGGPRWKTWTSLGLRGGIWCRATTFVMCECGRWVGVGGITSSPPSLREVGDWWGDFFIPSIWYFCASWCEGDTSV